MGKVCLTVLTTSRLLANIILVYLVSKIHAGQVVGFRHEINHLISLSGGCAGGGDRNRQISVRKKVLRHFSVVHLGTMVPSQRDHLGQLRHGPPVTRVGPQQDWRGAECRGCWRWTSWAIGEFPCVQSMVKRISHWVGFGCHMRGGKRYLMRELELEWKEKCGTGM